MKHLPLFAFVFILNGCFPSRQANVITKDPICYSAVAKVENVSQQELFTRARAWFADNFEDSKNVLRIQDKDAGELIGKGSFDYKTPIGVKNAADGYITFRIKIFTKDGRYKYQFESFFHHGSDYKKYSAQDFRLITTDENCPYDVFSTSITYKKWRNKIWKDIKKEIDLKTAVLISDLNKAMPKPSSGAGW